MKYVVLGLMKTLHSLSHIEIMKEYWIIIAFHVLK